MTKKKKWKVGILGLGHWYSAYGLARSLPEYPRAELVAVAAADSPHLDQFAQTFGVPSYHDPAALLERRDIDIVQISARVSQVPGLTPAGRTRRQTYHPRQTHGDDTGQGR